MLTLHLENADLRMNAHFFCRVRPLRARLYDAIDIYVNWKFLIRSNVIGSQPFHFLSISSSINLEWSRFLRNLFVPFKDINIGDLCLI